MIFLNFFYFCVSILAPWIRIRIRNPGCNNVSVVGKWKHRVWPGGRVLHPPHPPAPRQPAPGHCHHPPPPRAPLPPGIREFGPASDLNPDFLP
jgi:hypothetical protein